MKLLFDGLTDRAARTGRPARVGVIGAGFFAGGSVRQLARVSGIEPCIVANRTLARAYDVMASAGITSDQVLYADNALDAAKALNEGKYVVSDNIFLPCETEGIDAVVEATGDIEVGVRAALAAIEHGKHIIAANLETQATFGHLIARAAERAGVVYSDVDGDQPGLIMNLWDYCTRLGMDVLVAGNCKGVLKRYATPATQEAFASANGIAPWIATAAADGTKICIEMAAVANATGTVPFRPGMSALETSLETMLADLKDAGLLDGGHYVEYTLGIPGGTFVVARSDDPYLQREFSYLKMGEGPDYLFYDSRVLCSFDLPVTVAKAVISHSSTIAPAGQPVAQVGTYAKTGLSAGKKLDGIGGFDTYGLIVSQEQFEKDDLLPVGLSSIATLKHDIATDGPVRFSDVDLDPDSALLAYWKQQAREISSSEVTV